MPPRDADPVTPLTVPAFQILLSLWDRDDHGYAIIRDIEERTGGEVRLTASTLYGAIARLLDAGLIDELPPVSGRDPNEARRRCYRIAPKGRDAVQAEVARLERQLGVAHAKRVRPVASSPSESS